MKDIDFSQPQVVVTIAKPRSGKTNSIKYWLLKNFLDEKIFKFCIVFTRTKFDNEYDYIPEKYIYTEYDPDVLKKYMDGLEKIHKENGEVPANAVVIDDQQGLLNRNDPILTNFISSHRHYNCSVFFNFQYLFGASPLLRECTTYALMFRSHGHRTINGLFENFGMLFDDFNSFKKYFLKNTKKRYTGILYSQAEDNVKKNYARFKAPNMEHYKGFQLHF